MKQSIEAAQRCQKALEAAQEALVNEVVALFPVGARVSVKLTSIPNQGRTWGRVMSHGTGNSAGEVRVKLDTATNLVRDFWWERLLV